MPRKINLLLIIIIISITITLSNRHFDLSISLFDFNTKEEKALAQPAQNQMTHEVEQYSNVKELKQHAETTYVEQANEQEPVNTKRSQCIRPEIPPLTNQYFQLNTNLNNNSGEFTLELKNKLNAAFKHIEKSLNIKFNQGIALNMFFKNTREDYENLVREKGRSPEGNQGMHLSPENIAIIEVKNYEQGIKTSIHEGIHALNYTYFGYTLRFLNEGMAEYYKEISDNGDILPFDFTWLKHRKDPEQISTLLFSDVDWHGPKTHELYQQSKALIYFLMSNDNGKNIIWKILEKEMEEPCSVLTKRNIIQLLFDNYPNHQQEFDYWFKDNLNDFLSSKM